MKKTTTITQLLFLALALVFGAGTLCSAADKSYIVVYKQPPGQADKDKVKNLGGNVKRQFNIIKGMAVDLPEQAMVELQSDSKVAYIEEDIPMYLVEPVEGGFEYENSWGVSRIGAFIAHENDSLGTGVKVAVLDTGIDYTHPELVANYQGGDNFIALDPDYHDPYDDSYNSHGTHVAGIIGAARDDAGVVGVAPQAELYAVKVLGGDGFGNASSLIAGLDWAVANGMDIANISIGATQNSPPLDEACQAAYTAGVLLVAAAGNTAGGDVLYPARYDSVIAVGGTALDDTVYWNSAVGPEIELAAPGLMVNSTIRVLAGEYGILSGTSQASPHVAGVAALLMGEGVDDLNQDGITNHLDVRLKLQDTALDLGHPRWDPVFGHGLVQASVDAPQSTSLLEVVVGRRNKKEPVSFPTILLDKGIFDLHITNDSLTNLTIKVLKNGHYLDKLEEYITFGNKDPQEVILTIDVNAQTFEVEFIPSGRRGSFATVEVTASQ